MTGKTVALIVLLGFLLLSPAYNTAADLQGEWAAKFGDCAS
jgi:hypothetical protein